MKLKSRQAIMYKNLTALFVKYGVRKGVIHPSKKNSYLSNKTCSTVVYFFKKKGRGKDEWLHKLYQVYDEKFSFVNVPGRKDRPK